MIKKCILAMMLVGSIGAPMQAAKADPDPFLGQTSYFPYTFCPRGWADADGRLLPISENSALFSLLGTNYGGDGRTTFGVPDFRRNGEPYKAGRWCIALQGIFPSRS